MFPFPRPQKQPLVTHSAAVADIYLLISKQQAESALSGHFLQWTVRIWHPSPTLTTHTCTFPAPPPELIRQIYHDSGRSAVSIYTYQPFPWLSKPALSPIQTYLVFGLMALRAWCTAVLLGITPYLYPGTTFTYHLLQSPGVLDFVSLFTVSLLGRGRIPLPVVSWETVHGRWSFWDFAYLKMSLIHSRT